MTEKSPIMDATRIGRSNVAKAPEFQELYEFEANALTLVDALFPYESLVHRAHVVMLAEEHILADDEAATILKGLRQVDAMAAADASLRTYLPYEAALIRTIGPVGGKMHLGRSRNDLANTVTRMFLRDQLLRTIAAVIGLRQAVVQKAADHLETVMVAYTHRKEAQPITLGHYLMAISECLGKHLDRYEALYTRLNQCPLGAAATAGTGWPINRQRTAALLGFEALVVSTIEAVAGWDHIAEFAFDNALVLSGVGRLASEMQLWSTDEYRMAELDPSFAGTSSIMPQKKNPDALERARLAAAGAMGPLVAILTSLNAIEYQHSGARVSLEPRAIDALIATTHAMTGVVRTLQPQKAQMLQYATENFATMTDVADMLVRETGMDFRAAHDIVAHIVTAALAAGKKANDIDVAMVCAAAAAQLGHPVDLPAGAVRDALDPVANVARRTLIGGPAPSAVQAMMETARQDIAHEEGTLASRLTKLEDAKAHLAGIVATMIA